MQARTGQLKFDEQTFRERSLVWPVLNPLRELRVSLAQLRLTVLAHCASSLGLLRACAAVRTKFSNCPQVIPSRAPRAR